MDGSSRPPIDADAADLSAAEVRVLGCLVEKAATTPDNYPLTLNSLRLACNQSTSRDPVVAYDDHDVEQALAALRERGLTRTVHSTANRAIKYRHVVPEALRLDDGEMGVLATLLLRGAQTVGELKSRTERLYHFESTDDVASTLTVLAERGLALQLERQPGQKDARWVHLMSGEPAVATSAAQTSGVGVADAASSSDPYGEASAEFYDLLATDHWETFGLQLLDLLADVDPTVGPIVDVGVGTGVGLPYLLAAVPGAAVHAIEPSMGMRTSLHTRLALDPDLREVVTVDARPLADAELPPRACALVMSAVLGHLTDAERDRLWRYLASSLPAGAPAVIEVLPPQRPLTVPPNCYRRLAVGRHTYEGWQEGEPVDGRNMVWTMTYRVFDGDREIVSHRVRAGWRCWSVADIRSEVAPFGLVIDEHDECVVLRRPA